MTQAPPSDLAGVDLTGIDSASSCAFSDEFAGAALGSCWQVLNATPQNPIVQVSQTGGALHLQAVTGPDRRWYNGSTGSLVYQSLTAMNFKITTTARPRKRTDGTVGPTIPLHVGGLLVRNPASQGGTSENYIMIMAGSNENGQPGVEIKSTANGQSQWAEPVWSEPLAAELRMCRLGSTFYLYKRAPGSATWILANHANQQAPISRPDLPETLQVGLSLNFGGGASDLDVSFDAITLSQAAPARVADCITP